MKIDFYSHIREENDHLEMLSKFERSKLHKQMKKVLCKYIRNPVLLDILVSQDLFLTEFAFLARAKKSKELSNNLAEMYKIYDLAIKSNKEHFIQLLADYSPLVTQAADNYAQMDNLLIPDLNQYNKVAAKQTFRELGDFLEGSFQVFTKFFLSCVYISEGKDTEVVHGMSFGQCVSQLNDRNILTSIYVPKPWGIPVSQWRNIANHNSYFPESTSDKIKCEYGGKNKKLIEITLSELYKLRFNLYKRYNAHKVSHATILLEHSLEVQAIMDKKEYHLETMLHQFKEFSITYGFKPVLLDEQILHKIKVGVVDNQTIEFSVENCGSVFDVHFRANDLAKRTSTFMAGNPIRISVFDSNESKIFASKCW
ncbi:hypothetical protein HYO28_05595 [Vibrio parahaemolyticus]|nr:hypothetical protein [Vibrio parahaemolyticus]